MLSINLYTVPNFMFLLLNKWLLLVELQDVIKYVNNLVSLVAGPLLILKPTTVGCVSSNLF